jgi:hypothetical protein
MKGLKVLVHVAFCALMISVVSAVWAASDPGKGSQGAGKPAPEEETIAGSVVKTPKGIIIEADDGDYLVKGKDLSSMVGKMVEVTGIITESDKGDVIEVKSFEEIQE